MEMITVSKLNGMTDEKEPRIQGLFPEEDHPRAWLIKKPTIFLSCRVHPGETPASYVLDGIMKFLLADSEQSNMLLTKFVFKIVPMLNPDGVYRGYFRLDTFGQNLNRFYTEPQL